MKKILLIALAGALAPASMATLFFNSTNNSSALTVRDDWLLAQTSAPTHFVDFESYTLNQNMLGVDMGGGAIIGNSGTGVVEIRGAGGFGGSNPVDTQGLWHNESAWLELNFTTAVSALGLRDIDHTGGTMRLTYTDTTTENFSMDGTGGSGNSAEFLGVIAEGGLNIVKAEFNVGGDNSWGIDNVEYTPVPEPATMTLLLAGVGGLLLKRKKKA